MWPIGLIKDFFGCHFSFPTQTAFLLNTTCFSLKFFANIISFLLFLIIQLKIWFISNLPHGDRLPEKTWHIVLCIFKWCTSCMVYMTCCISLTVSYKLKVRWTNFIFIIREFREQQIKKINLWITWVISPVSRFHFITWWSSPQE